MEGLAAFTCNKQGEEYRMSYYQSPEEALEDSEEMNYRANTARGVALKAASKELKK